MARSAALPLPVLSVSTLVLLLSVALTAAGCGSDARSEDAKPSEETAFPVEVAAVEVGPASAYVTGTATLEAVDDATVVARVGGVMEQVLVEEGQFVRSGQALARLDDERLKLELARAEVELQKLERVYERTRAVYEKQLVSQEEFEQARSAWEGQKVARDLAQLQVEYATVRAPISGVVSARHVKPGNMVQTNAPAFRITGVDPLWAVLHVPERNIRTLSVGQTATLQLDAAPDRPFTGTVARINPVVDPATGTFRAVIELRDPSRTARPGMFGRVRVQVDRREDARLIPKTAVIEEDNTTSVFVLRDTLALRRPVTTGYDNGSRVEITAGLTTDDTVIVSGQSALRDSARVDVVD